RRVGGATLRGQTGTRRRSWQPSLPPGTNSAAYFCDSPLTRVDPKQASLNRGNAVSLLANFPYLTLTVISVSYPVALPAALDNPRLVQFCNPAHSAILQFFRKNAGNA
ncbi:MAG: hypothetical protein ACRD2G_17050, partial [Terriglobia bacterium]